MIHGGTILTGVRLGRSMHGGYPEGKLLRDGGRTLCKCHYMVGHFVVGTFCGGALCG